MRDSVGTEVALVVIAVAALGMVALLLQMFLAALRRRRTLEQSWADLGRWLENSELSPEQRRLVRELATRYSPDNPMGVVEQIEVFERAVHRYLKPICADGPGADSQRAGQRLRQLRTKLHLETPSGVLYFSSRELEAGQEVELKPLGQNEHPCWGVVAEQREDFLVLKGVRPAAGDLQGLEVRVVFFRAGRSYTFETTVVAADSSASRCFLEHTLDVRTAGAREFHRVQVNAPAAVRAPWEDEQVQRQATLRDLSAGGAGLVSRCYFEDGEQVVVVLRPGDCLPEGAATEDEGPRDLPGTIVGLERTPGGRCRYHVEFGELDSSDRQFLFRLVNRLEVAGQE
ncbi:MAG: PilZ domain-containing protein [Candidatus Brocadiia bacterium]